MAPPAPAAGGTDVKQPAAASKWGLFKWGQGKKKVKVAHLPEGESNMYYHPELKRWVERGKEQEAANDPGNAPPPTTVSAFASQRSSSQNDLTPSGVSFGPAGSRKALSSRYVMQNNLSVSSSASDLTDAIRSASTNNLPPSSTLNPSPRGSMAGGSTPPSKSFFVPSPAPNSTDSTSATAGGFKFFVPPASASPEASPEQADGAHAAANNMTHAWSGYSSAGAKGFRSKRGSNGATGGTPGSSKANSTRTSPRTSTSNLATALSNSGWPHAAVQEFDEKDEILAESPSEAQPGAADPHAANNIHADAGAAAGTANGGYAGADAASSWAGAGTGYATQLPGTWGSNPHRANGTESLASEQVPGLDPHLQQQSFAPGAAAPEVVSSQAGHVGQAAAGAEGMIGQQQQREQQPGGVAHPAPGVYAGGCPGGGYLYQQMISTELDVQCSLGGWTATSPPQDAARGKQDAALHGMTPALNDSYSTHEESARAAAPDTSPVGWQAGAPSMGSVQSYASGQALGPGAMRTHSASDGDSSLSISSLAVTGLPGAGAAPAAPVAHIAATTVVTVTAPTAAAATGLHGAAKDLHSKGRELLGALAGYVAQRVGPSDDSSGFEDGSDDAFDAAMHPGCTGKLDGPLPWELPEHLRYSDEFLSFCTAWQRNNPGKTYRPELLLPAVPEVTEVDTASALDQAQAALASAADASHSLDVAVSIQEQVQGLPAPEQHQQQQSQQLQQQLQQLNGVVGEHGVQHSIAESKADSAVIPGAFAAPLAALASAADGLVGGWAQEVGAGEQGMEDWSGERAQHQHQQPPDSWFEQQQQTLELQGDGLPGGWELDGDMEGLPGMAPGLAPMERLPGMAPGPAPMPAPEAFPAPQHDAHGVAAPAQHHTPEAGAADAGLEELLRLPQGDGFSGVSLERPRVEVIAAAEQLAWLPLGDGFSGPSFELATQPGFELTSQPAPVDEASQLVQGDGLDGRANEQALVEELSQLPTGDGFSGPSLEPALQPVPPGQDDEQGLASAGLAASVEVAALMNDGQCVEVSAGSAYNGPLLGKALYAAPAGVGGDDVAFFYDEGGSTFAPSLAPSLAAADDAVAVALEEVQGAGWEGAEHGFDYAVPCVPAATPVDAPGLQGSQCCVHQCEVDQVVSDLVSSLELPPMANGHAWEHERDQHGEEAETHFQQAPRDGHAAPAAPSARDGAAALLLQLLQSVQAAQPQAAAQLQHAAALLSAALQGGALPGANGNGGNGGFGGLVDSANGFGELLDGVAANNTPTKQAVDAALLLTPQRAPAVTPYHVDPSPSPGAGFGNGGGDASAGASPVANGAGAHTPAYRPTRPADEQDADDAFAAALEEMRAELQADFDAQLSARTAELESHFDARLAAARDELRQHYEQQLAERDAEINAQRQRCDELQEDLDQLLLCLGQESRKVTDLSDAMRSAGLDPDAIIEPIEAEYAMMDSAPGDEEGEAEDVC